MPTPYVSFFVHLSSVHHCNSISRPISFCGVCSLFGICSVLLDDSQREEKTDGGQDHMLIQSWNTIYWHRRVTQCDCLCKQTKRGSGKKEEEKKKTTLVGPDVPLVLAAILEEVGVAVGTLLSPLHHHGSAQQGVLVCPAGSCKQTHSEHCKLLDV